MTLPSALLPHARREVPARAAFCESRAAGSQPPLRAMRARSALWPAGVTRDDPRPALANADVRGPSPQNFMCEMLWRSQKSARGRLAQGTSIHSASIVLSPPL